MPEAWPPRTPSRGGPNTSERSCRALAGRYLPPPQCARDIAAPYLTLRVETAEPHSPMRLLGPTLVELEAIANSVPGKSQLVVLPAAWFAPRFGELAGPRRRDVDLYPRRGGSPEADGGLSRPPTVGPCNGG